MLNVAARRPTQNSYLQMTALSECSIAKNPFDHLIVKRFLDPCTEADVLSDFPRISSGGSYPINRLSYGPSFGAIVSELTSGPFTEVLGGLFETNLATHPTLVTVRGRSRAKDGKIHTDNPNKLITLLLYFGRADDAAEGQLRLLRSPTNLDDYAIEVAPNYGTLLVFKNGPQAWHGFRSYTGARRVLQINWVSNARYVDKEEARHGFSALIKTILSSGRN